MGRMKDIAIDLGNNAHVHPTVYEALRNAILSAESEPYQVHILLCNGEIIGVYANKSTAEYERHLCVQGDSYDGLPVQDYVLMSKTVNTVNM